MNLSVQNTLIGKLKWIITKKVLSSEYDNLSGLCIHLYLESLIVKLYSALFSNLLQKYFYGYLNVDLSL